jgi:hypothetical protein
LSVASIRSPERRMIALKQANQVRGLRAKLKQDLRQGAVRLEQILATRADYLASAEVIDLLVAVPKIGSVKAGRLLTVARISPSKTVGALSGRQRLPGRPSWHLEVTSSYIGQRVRLAELLPPCL